MTFPYSLRLLCLCLAAFFLVHLAVGLVVARMSAVAIRVAQRMRPRRAAWFLLALRLLPPMAALAVVGGLCAPSYLLLEPPASAEEVGLGCLAAALFGLAIGAWAAGRSVRALWSLRRSQREWNRTARRESIGCDGKPALVLEDSAPFLALAGVFRPRLVISRSVVDTLSPEELRIALRHELAHLVSRDNLKRLILLLAPDLFPASKALQPLERAWSRFAEWAADDRAVDGDPQGSVALAAALVRVARLGGAPTPSPLVTSLLADSSELTERVERLLGEGPIPTASRLWAVSLPLLSSAALLGVVMLTQQPGALNWVHKTLEQLVH